MSTKPPLGLSVEIIDASGARTRWDSSDSHAANRPQNLGFTNSRGVGFGTGEVTLARRIDQEHIDLGLLNQITFIGDDASVAYEGAVTALPRSMQQTHSVSVQAAGYMGAARYRKFREIYVDRDMSGWTQETLPRRAQYATSGLVYGRDYTIQSDRSGVSLTGVTDKQVLINSSTEAWYYAPPGVTVAKVAYDGTEANTTSVLAAQLRATDTLDGTSLDTVALTLDDTLRTATLATARRYVLLLARASATHTPTAQFTRRYSQLAVYGNHGLETVAITGEPDGVTASDVIRHVATNYAPLLDASGVQDTTYPIAHLVFADRTDPYEAFLQVNAFHLWDLAVWENRVLHFGPVDMTDHDWQIRLDDPGVTVDLQGDSIENMANGIVVQYVDVTTGQPAEVTPDDSDDLLDTDPENPANKHGHTIWTEVTLSAPTTEADAVERGRALLAEFTSPRAPGTITIRGHVRDRQGNWQQVWKVRPGDTIAITNHPNDRPRLVVEASYNHDSHAMTLTIEGQPRRMEAVFARHEAALAANGLI